MHVFVLVNIWQHTLRRITFNCKINSNMSASTIIITHLSVKKLSRQEKGEACADKGSNAGEWRRKSRGRVTRKHRLGKGNETVECLAWIIIMCGRDAGSR